MFPHPGPVSRRRGAPVFFPMVLGHGVGDHARYVGSPRVVTTGARPFLVFLVVLATLTLTACGGPGESAGGKQAKAERAVPVTVAAAVAETVPVLLEAVGNVEPVATVEVRCQVGGLIVEQRVTDGQDVKKGDLLFRLDPRPLQLAVREVQGELERDRALLDNARQDLVRYERLRKVDVVAQEQFDQTYAKAKSLEGTIAFHEAALERARLDLEYSEIHAAISGRVGAVLVHHGNVIKANDDRVMCVINQIEPIYVSFALPEKHLPAVMSAQAEGPLSVQVTTKGAGGARETGDVEGGGGTGSDWAGAEQGGVTVMGRLAAVDNAVDARTGTIRLRALYENADRRLWPGQFVRVALILGKKDKAVLVPTQAVLDGLEGSYVWVAKSQPAEQAQDQGAKTSEAGSGQGEGQVTAEARRVRPGAILAGRTVIEAGLDAGERVVLDGQLRLSPGVAMEIKTGKAEAAAGAGADTTGKAGKGEKAGEGDPAGKGGSAKSGKGGGS